MTMSCVFLADQCCELVAKVAGLDRSLCSVTEAACRKCLETDTPQTGKTNSVVASLALSHTHTHRSVDEYRKLLHRLRPHLEHIDRMPPELTAEQHAERASMQCPHLADGGCRVVAELCQSKQPVPVEDRVCYYCTKWPRPQQANRPTAAMALRHLRQVDREHMTEHRKRLMPYLKCLNKRPADEAVTTGTPLLRRAVNLMDVVYPLSSGRHGKKVLGSRWDDNELRYSLRSLEKHFPRLGRVFVVTGTPPDWLTGVEHVYAEDVHRSNKDANLIDKVLLACKAGASDTFIRLSDDQCLLRYWDGQGAWHAGDTNGGRGGKWWRRYQHTCDYLKEHGRPTWFYDCHCPAPVYRDAFIQVAEEADYHSSPGMCINTLYFNSVDVPRELMNGQTASVHRPLGPKSLKRMTRGKLFLGYSEAGTNKWLKRFLHKTFPEKSRFEK